MKETILATVKDLVGAFLYYDRKDDEELSNHALNKAVEDGAITVDECVEQFRKTLTENAPNIREMKEETVNIFKCKDNGKCKQQCWWCAYVRKSRKLPERIG